MKRRIIGLLIALCLVGTLFTACSQDAPSGNSGFCQPVVFERG